MQLIKDITISKTNLSLQLPDDMPLISTYYGKVRDVYMIGDTYIVMIATDRISAFDHILPSPIPYKGRILNGISSESLEAVSDIVPTWLIDTPHPNVSIGYQCEPIKLEMVIRGYLAGHAWREYKDGKRVLCGVSMPDGMQEGDKFPEPIITPAIKAEEGHDEDIAKTEILEKNIVNQEVWDQLEAYTKLLFTRGAKRAALRGLILVDTKYEFGIYNGKVMLMDEIHTPDSSRYYYADGYDMRQKNGEPQEQLSKEFVREWLMAHNFQGLEGQFMPEIPEEFAWHVSQRYQQLYQLLSDRDLDKQMLPNEEKVIQEVVNRWFHKNIQV